MEHMEFLNPHRIAGIRVTPHVQLSDGSVPLDADDSRDSSGDGKAAVIGVTGFGASD